MTEALDELMVPFAGGRIHLVTRRGEAVVPAEHGLQGPLCAIDLPRFERKECPDPPVPFTPARVLIKEASLLSGSRGCMD